MLEITSNIAVDESELSFEFVRASGPGGQNVNKVASAVQLRFDLAHSPSLPESVRQRAMKLAGNRLTNEGVLVISASSERSQLRNREEAVNQLVDLLRRAAKPPKLRRKTKPTASSRRKRIEKKRRRSQTKRNRRPVRRDDY